MPSIRYVFIVLVLEQVASWLLQWLICHSRTHAVYWTWVVHWAGYFFFLTFSCWFSLSQQILQWAFSLNRFLLAWTTSCRKEVILRYWVTDHFLSRTGCHGGCFRSSTLNWAIESFRLRGRWWVMVTVSMVFQRLFWGWLFYRLPRYGVWCWFPLNWHDSLLLRSEYLIDAFINKISVLFKVELFIITDRWTDWLAALYLCSDISKLCHIMVL